MSTLSPRVRAEALLLLTVVVWSLNFSVSRYALGSFAPLAFTAPRYALAGLIVGGLTLRREGSLGLRARDARIAVLAAVIGIWLNQLAFMYALKTAGAATVSLFFGTAPVLVAILTRVSGFEAHGRRTWVATAVSSAGIALLVLGSSGSFSASLAGILLCLTSSLTWATYTVLLAPLTHRYSPVRLSAVITLAGSIPLLVTAIPQLVGEDWAGIGPLGWLAFLYGLLPSYVVANLVWFHAVRIVGAARSAMYVNLEPFLGALFAVVLLSEHIHALQVLGGLIATAAIALLPRSSATRRTTGSPSYTHVEDGYLSDGSGRRRRLQVRRKARA